MGVVIELERRPVVLELPRRPWVIEKGVGRVGPKGNPGGNVESIGLLDDLPDLVIPAGTERISTTGIDTLGNDPATFIQTAETGPATWRKRQSADGRWFARHFENRSMPIEATGAKTSRADNGPYLQAAIDWLTAQPGGGRILVTMGDWETQQRIEVKSSVVIEGLGARSHLVNTKTDGNVNDRIALQFGNYKASSDVNLSFADEDGFGVDNAPMGQSYVKASTTGDAANAAPGDLVAIFNSIKAATSSWRHFMQLNRVVSVDGGTGRVYLAAPLYKALSSSGFLAVLGSAGLTGFGDAAPPAYAAFRAGARKLGLSSLGYKALGFSGMIGCALHDLVMHKSLRLFSGQGMAYSEAVGISGYCDEQAINAAQFSSHSLIERVHAIHSGTAGSGTNTGLLLEEGVHDMVYRNIRIDGGLSADLKDAIKISKAASNNTIDGLIHTSGATGPSLLQRAYSEAGMPGGGHMFRNLLGVYPAATTGSQINSTTTCLNLAAGNPDRLLNSEVRAPVLTAGQRTFVFNAGAGFRVERFKSDRGGVTVAVGATDHRIAGWEVVEDALGAITDNAGDFSLTGVIRGRVPKARARARRLTNITGISSTSAAYQVPGFAATYPVGALQTGDIIRVRAAGSFTGPAGARHVVLTLNGTEVARLDAGNTDNKGWSLDSEIIIRTSTSQRIETNYTNETRIDPSYESTTIDIATTAVVLDMLAYVAVGTDAVIFTKVTSDVDIQYAA